MTRRKKEASNKYWPEYGDNVVCALGHTELIFFFEGGRRGPTLTIYIYIYIYI
jgi:hypothetical protein